MKKTLYAFLAVIIFYSPFLAAEEDFCCRQVENSCCCIDDNYLYRWNLSLNPFGWIFGYYYGVSAAYALNSNVAVRGDVGISVFDCDTYCNTGVKFTVGLPIYVCRVYNGFFVEPQVSLGNVSESDCFGTSLGVVAGWHWMWDTGWNVSAAVGVGRRFTQNCCCNGDLRGYLQVGYNF